MQRYWLLGVLQVTTMALSNLSVRYLNYPTHVLFKSSKILPVMVVNVLYLRRKHGMLDVLGAICLVVGLSLFALGDTQVAPDWNPFGAP